jgi:hypothetical protein
VEGLTRLLGHHLLGRDWREVYQECAEAQKFADGLGLNLAVGAIPPTQQQDLVAAQPINRMGIIA